MLIEKKLLKKENPNKIINIVEKTLDFNEQQKGKVLKILTLDQTFQRLSIALGQVKTA